MDSWDSGSSNGGDHFRSCLLLTNNLLNITCLYCLRRASLYHEPVSTNALAESWLPVCTIGYIIIGVGTVEDRHASLRSAVSLRGVRDLVLRANKYLNDRSEIFRDGVRTGNTLLTVDPNVINIISYLPASRVFLLEFRFTRYLHHQTLQYAISFFLDSYLM